MKTIGQIIKDARVRKNYSPEHLQEITKIKSSFIEDIEKQKWENLPPFPTVLGFVKSLSAVLEIDPTMSVAVLKRDYPPRKLRINPKPDVGRKFNWSPKLTFIVGIILATIAILGYLGFQYWHFISPPSLTVDSPKDNQVVIGNAVLVFGTTDSDAKITVNNQPVIVDDNGKFSVNIDVSSETTEVDIKAISRSGKTTDIHRKIVVE